MIDWHFRPARAIFAESMAVLAETAQSSDVLEDMADLIAQSLHAGGKLMVCGNGGSAADADHIVAEFLVRLHPAVNRDAMAAIALTQGTPTLTAMANDYSFDVQFSRLLLALGRPEDVLLVFSTSGRSVNVIKALVEARGHGILTLGFLGSGGGDALQFCDVALVVPSNHPGRVQESHAVAIHILAELTERAWLRKPQPK